METGFSAATRILVDAPRRRSEESANGQRARGGTGGAGRRPQASPSERPSVCRLAWASCLDGRPGRRWRRNESWNKAKGAAGAAEKQWQVESAAGLVTELCNRVLGQRQRVGSEGKGAVHLHWRTKCGRATRRMGKGDAIEWKGFWATCVPKTSSGLPWH